jgi:hypothetical protein
MIPPPASTRPRSPPKDSTLAFDACDPHNNRLVPSIRWELLRDWMEDYAYLWLLNGGKPVIGETNQADAIAGELIASRTRFDRIPAHLESARQELAAAIGSGFGCSGDVVTLANHTFGAGSVTTCIAQTSMAAGPDLVVESRAELQLISPQNRLGPGVRMEENALFRVSTSMSQ